MTYVPLSDMDLAGVCGGTGSHGDEATIAAVDGQMGGSPDASGGYVGSDVR